MNQLMHAIDNCRRTTVDIVQRLRAAGHCQIGRIENGDRTRRTVYRFCASPIYRPGSSFHIVTPSQAMKNDEPKRPVGRPKKLPNNCANKFENNCANQPVLARASRDSFNKALIALDDTELRSVAKAEPSRESALEDFHLEAEEAITEDTFKLTAEERRLLDRPRERQKRKASPLFGFVCWLNGLRTRNNISIAPEAKGKAFAAAKRILGAVDWAKVDERMKAAGIVVEDAPRELIGWAITQPQWKDSFGAIAWLGSKLNAIWRDYQVHRINDRIRALRESNEGVERAKRVAERRAKVSEKLRQMADEERRKRGVA